MNLFILSLIPKKIAEYMMDKHISKILLEAVQMLCSAKRILDPEDPINEKIYKYRPEISTRTYLFNRNQLIIEQLDKLTKSDIQKFAMCIFDETNLNIVIINGN